MRFTAALRRFIAPSKRKMCPVGKRAHAWVHPHLYFYRRLPVKPADISRFLAMKNISARLCRSNFSLLSRSLLLTTWFPLLAYRVICVIG